MRSSLDPVLGTPSQHVSQQRRLSTSCTPPPLVTCSSPSPLFQTCPPPRARKTVPSISYYLLTLCGGHVGITAANTRACTGTRPRKQHLYTRGHSCPGLKYIMTSFISYYFLRRLDRRVFGLPPSSRRCCAVLMVARGTRCQRQQQVLYSNRTLLDSITTMLGDCCEA